MGKPGPLWGRPLRLRWGQRGRLERPPGGPVSRVFEEGFVTHAGVVQSGQSPACRQACLRTTGQAAPAECPPLRPPGGILQDTPSPLPSLRQVPEVLAVPWGLAGGQGRPALSPPPPPASQRDTLFSQHPPPGRSSALWPVPLLGRPFLSRLFLLFA